MINSGATYTTSTNVTLTLSASGATEMCISNTTSCTAWQSYATSRSWTLTSGDGTKKVYAKFRDAAGNTTGNYTDTITLDGTKPVNGSVTATPGDQQVSLSWSGFSDATSGLRSTNTYKVMRNTGTYPDTECTSGTQIYLGSGTSKIDTGLTNGTTYYYRVCAYDNADNISTGATASATPVSSMPNVTVILTPDATTVPRGGTLGYTAEVTNNTASLQCFDFWTDVLLPTGGEYPPAGELFGPHNLCLNAFQIRSAHLTQSIPMSAPLGTYTYRGFAGPYPTDWDSSQFSFTITSSPIAGTEGNTRWDIIENGFAK